MRFLTPSSFGHQRLRNAVDRRSLPAGAGMAAAYILVLAALERAPAAPVAALRETSILLAGVGGGRRRLAGSALVVAGIAAVVFG